MAYTKNANVEASVEAKITDLFINGLKQGIVGWQKPWITNVVGNVAYDSVYTGANLFWANLHASMYGVQAHYATVAGAAKKLGYKKQGNGYVDSKGAAVPFPIKKGAKGLHLIRVTPIVKECKDANGNPILDSNGDKKTYSFPTIKGFVVFSVDHLNWDMSKYIPEMKQNPLLDSGESILKGYANCPEIIKSNKAAYSPTVNKLYMPTIGQFVSSNEYYQTLFHELVHSTGHMDKLNRQGVAQFDRFGSHQYSYEELIAEIGAGMLCELSGIQMNVQNSQAYLNGWISKLESEPKWIFKAVNEAKKAVELILGRSLATAVEPTEAEAEAE
jgi:antirestriction protein ArdC